jgi:hypothetical protein
VTVAELRERLDKVPDHYFVVLERQNTTKPGSKRWRLAFADIDKVRVGATSYALGVVLTAGIEE